MDVDEKRKRMRELRWLAFQNISAGIVIIFAMGCFCFIFWDKIKMAGSQVHPYAGGKGFGLLLLAGPWGLWLIVRGVIYLIRAQSGNEQYAKSLEDVMDKFGSKHKKMMNKKTGNASMHNVLILLFWVFLVLAVFAAIGIGYLIWTRPH